MNLVNGMAKQSDGTIKSFNSKTGCRFARTYHTSEITEMYYVKRDLTKLNGITGGFEM